jgi:carbon storage regulator
MLILTRKLNEQVIVGGSIRITVVETRGSEVILAIEAPAEITIKRGEIPARGGHAGPRSQSPRRATIAMPDNGRTSADTAFDRSSASFNRLWRRANHVVTMTVRPAGLSLRDWLMATTTA